MKRTKKSRRTERVGLSTNSVGAEKSLEANQRKIFKRFPRFVKSHKKLSLILLAGFVLLGGMSLYLITSKNPATKDDVISKSKESKSAEQVSAPESHTYQASIKIVNKITAQPIDEARVLINSEVYTSDKDGIAVVGAYFVGKQEVKISASGFNEITSKIDISEEESAEIKDTISLVPSGKIYYLSENGNKIDTVKSNIDGSDRTVIVPGTGYESKADENTVLLSSTDWRFLALKIKRTTQQNYQAIYFIDSADDQLKTIDEGDADFNINGWIGGRLIYTKTEFPGVKSGPDKYTLRSFNPDTSKITILDKADGLKGQEQQIFYVPRLFTGISSVGDRFIYFRNDSANNPSVDIIDPDGSNHKVLLAMSGDQVPSSIVEYRPYKFYINIYSPTQQKVYEFKLGDDKPTEISPFGQPSYPYLLRSPSGKKTLWNEDHSRDVLHIGDENASNDRTSSVVNGYAEYGWFTDDYILVSKGTSLFILSSDLSHNPLLIDSAFFHRYPNYHSGYIYGYGDL